MHDTADLVLEAVVNSVEAGAESISVLIRLEDGQVHARIEDDGSYSLIGDPFGEGITTKGEGRGRGLHIIKEQSEGRCRLTRGKGITVLEFSTADDGSFRSLDTALLPLLNMEKSITVEIWKDGRAFGLTRNLLEQRDAVPDGAEGIRRFREILNGLEKGDIYG